MSMATTKFPGIAPIRSQGSRIYNQAICHEVSYMTLGWCKWIPDSILHTPPLILMGILWEPNRTGWIQTCSNQLQDWKRFSHCLPPKRPGLIAGKLNWYYHKWEPLHQGNTNDDPSFVTMKMGIKLTSDGA